MPILQQMCLFNALLTFLSNFYISKFPQLTASCYDTQKPTGPEVDWGHGQWLPCHYMDTSLMEQTLPLHRSHLGLCLLLTLPSPKGKEFNYTLVLYSDTLGSNWLHSSKMAWKKGLNKEKYKNLFYRHETANKAEEGRSHHRNSLTCYWLIYSSAQFFT